MLDLTQELSIVNSWRNLIELIVGITKLNITLMSAGCFLKHFHKPLTASVFCFCIGSVAALKATLGKENWVENKNRYNMFFITI
jgi:hypothetical protein